MKIPFQTFASSFQVTSALCLGDQTFEKVVLCKDDQGDTPIARQKTREKVVRAIKPEITTCNICRIITSDDEGSYNVASNAISSQTIMNGIKQYVVQYNMISIIMIPKGVSSLLTPASITSTTVWMNGIEDYDKIKDGNYAVWQVFILHHGSDVEVESDAWLESTLLLSMESTLQAEVESDLKSLPVNQRGVLTMLRFIIKHMVIRNQEVWDALEEYIKMFDICNFPGENFPIACLKLKAVVTVLDDKLQLNAVCTLLEGFARASTKSFLSV